MSFYDAIIQFFHLKSPKFYKGPPSRSWPTIFSFMLNRFFLYKHSPFLLKVAVAVMLCELDHTPLIQWHIKAGYSSIRIGFYMINKPNTTSKNMFVKFCKVSILLLY